MKSITLILLLAVLGLGAGTDFSYGSDKGVSEHSSSGGEDVGNLNFSTSPTPGRKYTLKAGAVAFQEAQREITVRVKTDHALIYTHKELGTAEFLVANFDRIFEMVAGYFKLEIDEGKIVAWVVDFDALQKIDIGQTNYAEGNPWIVAAIHIPYLHYLLFTSRYMNDYYLTHEVVHHFIDQYPGEVAASLPQVITQQNIADLPLRDLLRRHEEKIAVELSQIIIRKSLAPFALRGIYMNVNPKGTHPW